MNSCPRTIIFIGVFVVLFMWEGFNVEANDAQFDVNYVITYGNDHVLFLDQGREVQLSMDQATGSGFGSKLNYGSGFFEMKMKLHDKDSAGVITPFYLTSDGDHHDEIDFEFLGNREGRPITLQTNVYVNGIGGREQRINLWFDPRADFHTYQILWNQYQVVWFVDNIPIRVFKNNRGHGVLAYPTQAMRAECSIWQGDWATDGGQTKIDWTHAPFTAHFQGFSINGCHTQDCDSYRYWWNQNKYWKLDFNQQKQYANVKKNFMNYDYCADRSRYPTPHPECAFN